MDPRPACTPPVDPVAAVATELDAKFGKCFFYTLHPMARPGVEELVDFLIAEASKGRRSAAALKTAWEQRRGNMW